MGQFRGAQTGVDRVAFRVRFRARLALHHGRLSQDDCAARRGGQVGDIGDDNKIIIELVKAPKRD
jgi:hypothetical protein